MKVGGVHVATAFSTCISPAMGLTLTYCLKQHVGGGQTSSLYMSNGLCKTTCSNEGYAVAVLQGESCWCTNEVPGDTSPLSNCDENCPGFPEEKCAGDGYFGYLVIGNPSGTQSALSSSSTLKLAKSSSTTSYSSKLSSALEPPSKLLLIMALPSIILSNMVQFSSSSSLEATSMPNDTPIADTLSAPSEEQAFNLPQLLSPLPSDLASLIEQTSQEQPRTSSDYSNTSKTSTSLRKKPSSTSTIESSEKSTSTSSTSTAISSQAIPEVVSSPGEEATTIYSIKTVQGNATRIIITQYVIPTPSTTATYLSTLHASNSTQATSSYNKNESFFDSKGKVAATFTTVGIVVVAAVSTILYCCFHERENALGDDETQYSSEEEYSANQGKMSAYGEGLKRTWSTTSRDLNRHNSKKSILSLFAAGGASMAPGSSRKKLYGNSTENLRAANQVMFPITELDSRLDPNSMFMNRDLSKMSLGDENDYSRRILHLTNP